MLGWGGEYGNMQIGIEYMLIGSMIGWESREHTLWDQLYVYMGHGLMGVSRTCSSGSAICLSATCLDGSLINMPIPAPIPILQF